MKLINKLILSFVIVSIIPIIITQVISFYTATSLFKSKISDLTVFNLKQYTKNLDTSLEAYIDTMNRIFTDDIIVQNINIINQGNEDQYPMAVKMITERLKIVTTGQNGIRSCAIMCKNGTVIFNNFLIASEVDNIWMDIPDARESYIYKDTISTRGILISPTELTRTKAYNNAYLFHVSRAMFDLRDIKKGPIGIGVVSIDEAVIYNMCNYEDENHKEYGEIPSFNFIIDNDDNIISFPIKQYIGTNLREYGNNVKREDQLKNLINACGVFDNKPTMINSYTAEVVGWTVVNVYDQAHLLKEVGILQRLGMMIIIIAILFAILIISLSSREIISSIKKIIEAMQTAQKGDLSVKIAAEGTDEIADIARTFNNMIAEIRTLMYKVKQATFKQKEAEIRALEAQINPHFLYNTLDSINWMAIEKEEHEISKMLSSLGMILRYSIDKSNKLVTVNEEVEWLKKYIYLQQSRFNYSFSYEIQIEEYVGNHKMPKMLLQPFIENALIHGLEGVEKGGEIRVKISLEDKKHIAIEISDNGKGIKPEVLLELNKNLEDNTGIGVKNVLSRIHMYYGERASWDIKSISEKGTKIFIKLPIEQWG
jgi:two-component system sensor histidine kinase YesM